MLNRRQFLAKGALGAAALGLQRLRSACAGSRGERPNVLFIFIDDMGYADPSCFGNPKMLTPNIDRLAWEGMRLTNFYVNKPICSPARVAVTTGQYPGRWGIHSYIASRARNEQRGMADYLDPKAPSIGRIFQDAGYATAHFGKWHMGGGRDVGDAPLPQEYGFEESLVAFEGLGDRVLPPGGLSNASEKLGRGETRRVPKHKLTEIYVDRTIDFIKDNPDRPFFIRLFPNDVHDVHAPAPGSTEKWKSVTSNPYEQKFFAVLEELDRQIGRVMEFIDRSGLDQDTLIVFTSDNGPTDWPRYYREGYEPPGFTGPFYGRKWSLYEGGIRMPFIARWPGTIPAGARDGQTIMAGMDLVPMFCSLAGVDVPEDVQFDGEDLSDALLGTPVQRENPLFWQYGPPHATLMPGKEKFISPSLAVRDGDWKLLINHDGTEAELYNLQEDPRETHNLFNEHPERVKQLWKAIRKWAADVGHETQPAKPKPPEEMYHPNI